MAKKSGSKLVIALDHMAAQRLHDLANAAGVSVEAYAQHVVIATIIGGGPPGSVVSNAKVTRQPGRPAKIPTDLPPNIERDASATGFAGVYQRGASTFIARIGRQEIGRFSSAPTAAIARYYALHGFYVGRTAVFHALGFDAAAAAQAARAASFGAVDAQTEDALGKVAVDGQPMAFATHVSSGVPRAHAAGVAQIVDRRPPTLRGELNGKNEGRRANNGGGTGSAASTQTLSRTPPQSQVLLDGCAGCGTEEVNDAGLCRMCESYYEEWRVLPASGASSEVCDTFEPNIHGSPSSVSFAEYVRIKRGLA